MWFWKTTLRHRRQALLPQERKYVSKRITQKINECFLQGLQDWKPNKGHQTYVSLPTEGTPADLSIWKGN